jgi:hypothetical protein
MKISSGKKVACLLESRGSASEAGNGAGPTASSMRGRPGAPAKAPGSLVADHLIGIEKLEADLWKLDVGERDKACVAWAVSRFLESAPHVSALGDALWPANEERPDAIGA